MNWNGRSGCWGRMESHSLIDTWRTLLDNIASERLVKSEFRGILSFTSRHLQRYYWRWERVSWGSIGWRRFERVCGWTALPFALLGGWLRHLRALIRLTRFSSLTSHTNNTLQFSISLWMTLLLCHCPFLVKMGTSYSWNRHLLEPSIWCLFNWSGRKA